MEQRDGVFFRSRADMLGLAGFAGLCLLVSALGGAVTATSVTSWYPTLVKPTFNPPNWAFGPVWTVLYICMAVAAWRVWRQRSAPGRGVALSVFGVQLALNLAWSFIFFGAQRIDLAMVDIVLLLLSIVVTAVLFWRIDRPAGLLFVPYIVWVGYAATLTLSLLILNT